MGLYEQWNASDWEASLKRTFDGVIGPSTTEPKNTAPIMQALLFLGDVLLAATNRDTLNFFTERSKKLSPYIGNAIALDNIVRTRGWKKIIDGSSPKLSWREKAAFWTSLANALVLANTAISLYSPVNTTVVQALEIGEKVKLFTRELPSLAEMVRRGNVVSRIGFHGSVLIAESGDRDMKFSRGTYRDTATKIASVASSMTALGGIAASWAGLTQVSTYLSTASGVLGSIRFFASWNDAKPGNELLHLKQEMNAALNVFVDELNRKLKVEKIDQRAIMLQRSEVYAVKNTINSICINDIGMTASVIVFSNLKSQLDEHGYLTKSTSDKANHLIGRVGEALLEKHATIERKNVELIEQDAFLKNLSNTVDKKLAGLEAKYNGYDVEKQWVKTELESFKNSVTRDRSTIQQLLETGLDSLDNSNWLKKAIVLTDPTRMDSLKTRLKNASIPPSAADQLHL